MALKRIVALTLCLVMLAGLLPAEALAARTPAPGGIISVTHVNPIYAHVITEADLVKPADTEIQGTEGEAEYLTSLEAVGAVLREAMKNRQTSCTVYYQTDAYNDSIPGQIAEAALAHTGVPTEGDYLRWQYAGYEAGGGYSTDGTDCFIDLTYTLTYYTTAAQETEVDTRVSSLLGSLNLGGASDYEKLCGIYDWICGNVVYDYDHLDNDAYKLQYTAYAALVNGTSVCQGYAVLLYRLALSLGVDCRIITGTGNGGPHAWNIAKLDGAYYNLDATWDAVMKQNDQPYEYFLLCENAFTDGGTDHIRNEEFNSAQFHAAYPISETDYETAMQPVIANGTCGTNLTWTLDEGGTLIISGTGAMKNFEDEYEMPWYNYLTMIEKVVIRPGVTTVGNHAFRSCSNLVTVSVPDSVESFGVYAFSGCSALTEITIPEKQTYIFRNTFSGCTSLRSVTIPSSVTEIGDNAFAGAGLIQVTIPDSVFYIYNSAFNGCSDLEEAWIGSEVYSISEKAFAYCPKLKTVWFAGDAPRTGANNVFASSPVTAYYPAGNGTWTEIARKGISADATWVSYCNHNWAEATCTTPRTCTLCGETEGEAIGHSYESTVTAPTCTEQGYTTHTCANCGDSYVDTYVDALGHDMGDWVTTKAPTCTEDGSRTRSCQRSGCDYAETEEIAKTGHNYSSVVTSPTCTEQGYTTHTCANCSHSYLDSYVDALGHDMGDWFLQESGIERRECSRCDYFETRQSSLVDSGTCGANLTWTLDTEGTLTISGSGSMLNYGESAPAPWYAYQREIRAVRIESGVENVGIYAFYNCINLTDVSLPESLIRIGGSAFENCSSLTDIVIPESVSDMHSGAFRNCTGLKNITLPEKDMQLGSYAFYGCSSLTSVVIPDGTVIIGDNSFAGCSSLESVAIPDGLISIGDYVFEDCSSLTSVNIPDSVLSIGGGAFYCCSSLESVTIPEGVTSISEALFMGCSGMTSVQLPKGLTGIGNHAFDSCSGLKCVEIPEGVTTIGEYLFYNCTGLESIVIPEAVTYIGHSAFWGCTGLESIVIPNGVTDIESYTFHGCSALTNIELGNGITYIGRSAFQDCTGLESIVIPDGVTEIIDATFSGCAALTSVVLPEGLTSIGASAFYRCDNLWHVLYKGTEAQWNEIAIERHNTSLSNAIRHYECTGDEILDPVNKICSICDPDIIIDMHDIGANGWTGNEILVYVDRVLTYHVTLEDGKEGTWRIPYDADKHYLFSWKNSGDHYSNGQCSFEIYLGRELLRSMTANECYNCYDHTVLCTICAHTWQNATCTAAEFCTGCGLTQGVALGHSYSSVVTPPTCTEQGYTTHTCANCGDSYVDTYVDALGHDMGDWVTTKAPTCTEDGSRTRSCQRSGCDYTETEPIAATGHIYEAVVTEPTCTEQGYTTHTCANCGDSYVDSHTDPVAHSYVDGMCRWCGEEGPVASGICGENVTWILSSDGTMTISGTGVITSKPYDDQLMSLEDVTVVIIQPGVEGIGESVFVNFRNVTSITIPASVKTIGTNAFSNCFQLREIVIPKGVTSLGRYAFHECTSLSSVTLGDTITSIGEYAFSQCTALTTIDIPDSVTSIGRYAFENCRSLTSITIPDSVTSLGGYAFYNCENLSSIMLGDGIVDIGEGTFEFCSSLSDIILPARMCSIGAWAFHGCSSLVSFAIPDGTTAIGEGAFSVCSQLTSVTLPGTLTEIGIDAFSACPNLTGITLPDKLAKIGDSAFSGCKSLTVITIPDGVIRVGDGAFSSCTNLHAIYFEGSSPKIGFRAFYGVEATAYYPSQNDSWSEEVMQDYGGNITWVAVSDKPAAPTVKATNVASSGKVKVTWEKVEGAVKYEVYRATSKTDTYSRIYTTSGTSLTNTSTTAGKAYYYKVRSVDANGNKSEFSNIVSRTCDLPRPEITLSNVASSGKIKISWAKIDGAAKYEVYRSTDNKTWKLLKSTTGTSLTNTSTTAGTTYYYKVKAIHEKSAANSAYSSVKSRTCDLARPEITLSNIASSGKIRISWKKIEGAVKYEVYRSTDNKTWTLLKSTTGTSLTNTSTTAGKLYYYKVKAIASKTAANSAYSEVKSRRCDLARPTLTVKLNSSGKPVLSWTKIEGAVKYEVYRSTDNKTWTRISTTTKTSLTNTSVKAGTTYYYKVRAIASNTAANSAYCTVKSIAVK